MPSNRGGPDHGSIDRLPVGVLAGGFLNHTLEVKVAHGLFHNPKRIQRQFHIRQIGAEQSRPRGGDLLAPGRPFTHAVAGNGRDIISDLATGEFGLDVHVVSLRIACLFAASRNVVEKSSWL
jgi:hypothetical protein